MTPGATEQLYHTELIDGQEIQKPLPKKLHMLIQRYLTILLMNTLPKQFEILPELNIWCGLTVSYRI